MRKMAESKQPTISQLARAFELATTQHQEQLAEVQERALRYKAESDRRFDEVAQAVQKHMDNISALMKELGPQIRGLQQLDKKPTPTQKPVKASRTQRRA
jgi:hypothetical protein